MYKPPEKCGPISHKEFNTVGKILDVLLSLFHTALCKYNAAKYTFASRHAARVAVQIAAMQIVEFFLNSALNPSTKEQP
jgi:hypothetical protein